jgi:hypothetical protein
MILPGNYCLKATSVSVFGRNDSEFCGAAPGTLNLFKTGGPNVLEDGSYHVELFFTLADGPPTDFAPTGGLMSGRAPGGAGRQVMGGKDFNDIP